MMAKIPMSTKISTTMMTHLLKMRNESEADRRFSYFRSLKSPALQLYFLSDLFVDGYSDGRYSSLNSQLSHSISALILYCFVSIEFAVVT